MQSITDREMMMRAVRLADRAKYWARPNPHVGCVLTQGAQVVGEGFTQPAGDAHAEVMALRQAGDQAAGATAYVTLEPCAHHGRTPPCVQALVAARVARVVVGVFDPNPKVSGAGLKALRAAGITVEVGLLAAEVEGQLAGFLARHRRGRGRLRVKLAMSLDGRTAMASGESQWITGPSARGDVQRLRAESCAVLTGVGTVLADNCALSVRDEYFTDERLPAPAQRALRVVADSTLRTPSSAAVLAGEQPALLIHRADARVPDALKKIPRTGVSPGLTMAAILDQLAKRDCNEILLESGPTLAGAAFKAGVVDELIVYVAPRLLGSRARPLLELPLDQMVDALDLRIKDRRQFGDDLRLTFAPIHTDHTE